MSVGYRRALIDLGADKNGLVHVLRQLQIPKGPPSHKPDKRDPDRFEDDSSKRSLAGMGGHVKADGLTGLSDDAVGYFTAGGGASS
jgi:hypothetical protein